MGSVIVHPRVHERHPEITDDDVMFAWRNRVRSYQREASQEGQVAAIGFDGRGREIEMVAAPSKDGLLIFHAQTPATKKVIRELRLERRKRWTVKS